MDTQKQVVKWRLIITAIISLTFFTAALIYGIHNRYIYFASLMGIFFIPSVLFWYYIQIKGDRWDNHSLIIVLTFCFFLGVVIEFIAVYLRFWTFFTDVDPLLGINIGDIPIEEFIFYFGANMQLCFLYVAVSLKCNDMGITPKRVRAWLKKQQGEKKVPPNTILKRVLAVIAIVLAVLISIGLIKRFKLDGTTAKPEEKFRDKRNMPVYIDGVWYPGWLIAIVPFLTAGLLWFRAVIKKIHLAAFLFSLIINSTLYILFEYNAIMRGHWVYNDQRLLGWKFAGTIPLEQLVLYFVSFIFLIPFFESIRYLFIMNLGTGEEKLKYTQEIGGDLPMTIRDCKDTLLRNMK